MITTANQFKFFLKKLGLINRAVDNLENTLKLHELLNAYQLIFTGFGNFLS